MSANTLGMLIRLWPSQFAKIFGKAELSNLKSKGVEKVVNMQSKSLRRLGNLKISSCAYFQRPDLFRNRFKKKGLISLNQSTNQCEIDGQHSSTSGIFTNWSVNRYSHYKSVSKLNQVKVKAIKARVNKIREAASRENIYTIPNWLCVFRLGVSPYIAYLILQESFIPAIGLFTLAGITDLLDGYIARVVPGQSSVLGSFLDPMADKVLVASLFLALTYIDQIPLALTSLIIARDASLIVAGFWIRYQSLDPPRTLRRYFDLGYATAKLQPSEISKINTFLQLSLVATTLLSTVLPYDLQPILMTLWVITASTTIGSGLHYIADYKKSVKFLRNQKS